MEAIRDKIALKQLQSLPLDAKITLAEQRIMEWYKHFNGDVCISFSGGKDSTVLAHLVHGLYPEVPLVFANTGLEYPEIQAFARRMGAEFVRPRMSFSEVITRYGYPIISKEVSEAIHAARYIVSDKRTATEFIGGGGEEKARPGWKWADQKRDELNNRRTKGSTTHIQRLQSASETDGTEDLFAGSYEQEKHSYDKHNWTGWRRKAFLWVGDFDEHSMFCKKKWLPLCQETQFLIGNKCCNVMKKDVLKGYQRKTKRKPYLGTMAEESRLREQKWIQHGCNAYEGTRQMSAPLSLWTEQDILHYIQREGLEIASVYGDIVEVDGSGYEYFQNLLGDQCTLKCTGCDRTGCIFCGYGAHLEKQSEKRFQRLSKTHPKQYEYCMGGGQWVDNPAYDPTAPKMDGDWTNWNPKKIWVPSKEGLGMKYVFDEINKLYGKDFIRYE